MINRKKKPKFFLNSLSSAIRIEYEVSNSSRFSPIPSKTFFFEKKEQIFGVCSNHFFFLLLWDVRSFFFYFKLIICVHFFFFFFLIRYFTSKTTTKNVYLSKTHLTKKTKQSSIFMFQLVLLISLSIYLIRLFLLLYYL
jgi:hypothetical protein